MRVPLEIPPGLTSDDTTFTGPRWSDGDNVRPRLGRMEVLGGWTDGMSGLTLTGVCRNLLPLGLTTGGAIIAFGTHSALQVFQGGALYTITPSGLAAGSIDSLGAGSGAGYGAGTYSSSTYSSPASVIYARTWSLSAYGSYLIANPRGGTIYQWDGDTGALATAITNAPAIVTYALATPQRQILAFGCNEEASGYFNPLCIRGCDIEAITDWTTTATNNAFEHILDATGGRIVAALILGPYVAVWTTDALFLGEYLGNPAQTYRFDRVGDSCGLIAANAVAIIDSTAFWLAPDYQFRSFTIGGNVTLMQSPIGHEFADNVDRTQTDKICASALSQYNEIWWHYPDARDGDENSRYIALSLTEGGGWFKGTLARTASCNSGVIPYPAKVTYGGMVYYHEYGNTADSAALAWSLTTGDIYIGEADNWAECRGIWPDFEGQQGNVSLTVALKPYPQGTARTKGPYTLAVGALKRDFLVHGRLATFTFSGSAAPSFMRIGKLTLDVVPTGRQ